MKMKQNFLNTFGNEMKEFKIQYHLENNKPRNNKEKAVKPM